MVSLVEEDVQVLPKKKSLVLLVANGLPGVPGASVQRHVENRIIMESPPEDVPVKMEFVNLEKLNKLNLAIQILNAVTNRDQQDDQ